MQAQRKKELGSAALVVAALPVLYLLSMGPMLVVATRFEFIDSNHFLWVSYTTPLVKLYQIFPVLSEYLAIYIRFWFMVTNTDMGTP